MRGKPFSLATFSSFVGAVSLQSDFVDSLLFYKTTPVLKIFSSEPDGMPPIEAWRLKIIINI